MQRCTIPGTSLDVSRLCLGTAPFGVQAKDGAVDRLVDRYFQAGGNFVDTAHCYCFWEEEGAGASERALGESLRRLGLLSEAVIATKGCHPDAGEAYSRPERYLSPEVIASDVADSLDRLAVDRVDLYYVHRDDSRVPVSEVIDALNEEIRQGRIGVVGASNWPTARIEAANSYAAENGLEPFRVSQIQWSLAAPGWVEGPDPTMRTMTTSEAEWHCRTGLPVVAYSATANGYFAGRGHDDGPFASAENAERSVRAQELARAKGCTPTQLALGYLLSQSFTVYPCFSTTRMEHLEEILASDSVALSEAEVRYLWEG